MENLDFTNYRSTLEKKYAELKKNKDFITGYPGNQNFDYSILSKFFEFALNNIGDPLLQSNFTLNTHEFERDVITFISNLYKKENDVWGYITNGGTEGNLTGIHIGRSHYPEGIIYFSAHSHYSVAKAIELTRSKSSCISVLPNGEISYLELKEKIIENINQPVIILANIGTTMTGAIDDIQTIKEILSDLNISNYYIHCDAAFHGLILPFCNLPTPLNLNDFHSISVSGHKLIGSPIPCGVFLTHQNVVDKIKHYIEYIKSGDCTISGSRNGITPLILWCAIHQKTYDEFKNIAQECIVKAEYARDKMLLNGIQAWTNQYSPIVLFKKPSNEMIKKWSIAPYENISHIITTPNLPYETIDKLIDDLVLDKAKSVD
ncbi:histidine decarboxylase [Pigmentibacter sp. JX0631]|uniref:histidine decarboxylase n=1 Tax=Pigmentibacter sp. JX0631 TaxID=2976982 RepID=UPI0024698397|nr:histidine decarboxylase [Pigmentibacter sp. JX0631]WGL61112.1 histidine decarboxylase [Pigmentibacter sp. JX0631]